MIMAVRQALGSCRNLCPWKPFFPWFWWEVSGPLGLYAPDIHVSAIARGGMCVERGVAFPEMWLNLLFSSLVDRR